MPGQNREELRKRIVNFYNDAVGENVKATVKFFVQQGFKQRMIYYVLKRYKERATTENLPRSGRLVKISNKKLSGLVRKVNNKVGVSQRRLAKHYSVNQSTISKHLKRRTNIRIWVWGVTEI